VKCPECEVETPKPAHTWQTAMGYVSPPGHDHDDNCLHRDYRCENGHEWSEYVRRYCGRKGCDWQGKLVCFCHKGEKLTQWTDPPFYQGNLTNGG